MFQFLYLLDISYCGWLFLVICFLYFSHPIRCEVLSCDFYLHSLMSNDIDHVLYNYWPFVDFWRNDFSNPLAIFNWVFVFLYLSCLHIMNSSDLIYVWFPNALTSACRLSIFLMVSFRAQKYFYFDDVQFMYFFFFAYAFVSYLRSHCLVQGHKDLT